MKRTFFYKLLVFACFALVAINANSQCLSGWSYYAPVKVSNGNSTDLYTYQVKLSVNTQSLISAGKMQSTGADIRFTDSATCTVLPYWIESGINTSNTVIWVKTTKIPQGGSQTINMYYGNTSALAMTNGDSTFDLFDDFTGSALNTLKWTKDGPVASTFQVTGGNLNLKKSTPADAIIYSKTAFSSAITAEANVISYSGNSPSIAILNGSNGYTLNAASGNMVLNEAIGGCSSYKTSTSVSSSTSPGTITGIWGIQWPNTNYQNAFWPGGNLTGIDSARTISNKLNIAAGLLCNSTTGNTMSIDWIRVRKYAKVEPTTTVGKEKINNKITPVAFGSFCNGSSLKVPFTIVGTFTAGNTFTAQLSDSSGSFANPTVIGSKSTTTADTISCTLPANIYGNHYAIRIVGNYPDVTGYATPANIIIYAQPAAYAGKDMSICAGDSATIGGNGTSGNTYSWTSSPAGFTSSACKVKVSPSVTTTYTLTESNANGCVAKNSVTITVNSLPSAKAGKSRSICAGDSIAIGDSAVSGNTYSWTSSPSGFTSTLSNPVVKPSVTTTYTITETNASGCVASNSVTITVNALPSAKSGKSRSICSGDSVTLGDSAVSGNTYSWTSSPAGFTSALSNPVVKPSATTTYTLVETNANGCSAKNTLTVTVNARPAANAGKSQSICAGSSATIGATAVSGNTYSWTSSPAGFTSTDANPTVSPSATTTYTLVETNASGCVASNSVTITVNTLPSAKTGANKSICAGDSVTLGDLAVSGSSYSWTSSPTGFTSSLANPVVKPSVTTTYTLTETNANGCSVSNTVTVTVNAYPLATTGKSQTICAGGSATIGATAVSGNTYSWTSSPAGFTSTDANPTVNPATTTTYTLVETNANGCSAKNSVTISVNALPAANAGSSKTVCPGGSATIGATAVSGSTYSWTSTPSGFTSTAASVTVSPSVTTTYTLTETNANGCKNSNYVTVTVSPLPKAYTGGDKTVCQGNSVTLGGTAVDGNTYKWTTTTTTYSYFGCFGPTTTTTTVGTTASITVTPSTTTTYTLTETNASGCITINTVTVTVVKSSSVTLCSYANVCVDAAAFTLKGGSPTGGTYSGDGVSNGVFNPAVAGVGTHTITYSYTNAGGCTATATSTIKVNASPNPTITITGDTVFCQGGSVTLTSSQGDSYSWNTNNSSSGSGSCGSFWSFGCGTGSTCGGSSSSTGRSITVTQSGTYYVTVTTSGCSKTSRGVTVIVNPSPTVSAGSDITYYYGYDACPTLTATTTTSGASYLWSTGATTKSISVCPTSTTTYWVTVTNSSGCVSSKDYVTVTVVDVHCHDDEDYKGKTKDTTKKILVCHKGVQICVSKSAVAAYLKNGDHLGSCDGDGDDRDNGRSGNDGCGKTDAAATTTGIGEGLNVAQMFNVYPNPFSTAASVDLSFAKTQNVNIDVISIDGRVMNTLYTGNVIANTSYKLTLDAGNMNSGVYIIRVMSGDHIDYRRINLIR